MALADPLQLSVDTTNDSTPETFDYERIDASQSKSVYTLAGSHNDASRDKLEFFRTAPKPVASYFGNRKSAIKITRDYSVATPDGGNVITPLILDLKISKPVGVTVAQLIEAAQILLSVLDDDTLMEDICDQGKI